MGVISDLRRLRGRENPTVRRPTLRERASEDEAESARDRSRRFVDDDSRRIARGLAVALAGGVTLWALIAGCVWFFW